MGVGEQTLASETLTAQSCAWYAVCTRSRHEKVVDRELEERGVERFLPLRKVLSQWKDRRKWVQKPLFPGYLFARVEQEQLYLLTTTRGVAYVLGDGREPICVPDEQVEVVRRMVEGPYPVATWPRLQKGKRVRVITGPLAGLETDIVDKRGGEKGRLVVTIDILGRSVAVEIDACCVEPVL